MEQAFTDCFADYQSIAHMLKTCAYEEIAQMAADLAGSTPEAVEQYPVEYSSGAVIGSHRSVLQELQKNITQYDWLHDRLEDDISCRVLINLIGYRIFPGQFFLEAACDATSRDPVQEDIPGDDAFVSSGRDYDTAEEKNGLSDGRKGKDNVRTALLKNKKYIRNKAPKLTICLHYNVSDMWEVPRLIDAIRPGYRFFLRFHYSEAKTEIVLLALPREQTNGRTGKAVKRIVAMSAGEGWSDAQLVKDCGAISYLLGRNHSCDVSMVGARQGDYPNLKYVQGLKLEFLPDDTLQSKLDYLLKEAGEIDGLLLYGTYTGYLPLADVYKSTNPKGRIYLALDANSFWMDRIQWAEPEFCRLLDHCDVIGASGRVLQRHLNEKWPWLIEYIPNGFFNFTGMDMTFSYEKKKNVILTVGRLGTAQKATDVLLEAFAAIAEQIPDWNLHLAGTVEKEWGDGYLKHFWERFPQLRNRICFLGQISDREVLYQEYLGSKIFALPSKYEGGCPNVIAEALYAGDAIAITKIDEYRDAIGNGSCGLAVEAGDIEGFAGILLQLCRSEDLEKTCRCAHEYVKEAFDMERIVDRLYYLLFGEE